MHKFFMTEPEISVIQGAGAIVEELGGFPSMENGRLVSISIEDCNMDHWPSARNVTLVFDIDGWARNTSRYVDIPKPKRRYIRMHFSSLRDFYINTPSMDHCGEFKFGNTTNRDEWQQDMGTGTNPSIIERPFCCFYMRSACEGLILEFDEDTCKISAEFLDNSIQ